jgi:hypothetical protein
MNEELDFGEQVDAGTTAVDTTGGKVEEGNSEPDMSFDDILGYEYDDIFSENTESVESEKKEVDLMNETVAETKEVSNDEKRYEYWQSEYDKMRNEYETYQKSTAHLKDLDAAIRSDENLLSVLNDYFNNGGSATAKPAADDMKPPKDFDPYEAYNEPESDSYKWRVSKEQADRMKIIEEARNAAQNDILQQLQAEAQKQYQIQQEKAFRERYKDVPEEKWTEFISWSKNPENVTLDSLWKLYNLSDTSKAMETNARRQITEQLKRTQSMPSSPATANSESRKASKEEEFINSLISVGNRGNLEFL